MTETEWDLLKRRANDGNDWRTRLEEVKFDKPEHRVRFTNWLEDIEYASYISGKFLADQQV